MYSYHPLGFTSRLDSSDGKIHHAFTYNKLGYLKYALDEKHNIAIRREVDPFGNVIEESFPSGLEVKKEYDNCNRLTSLRIKDIEILYNYDSLFLREVTRASEGIKLYSHTYEDYDLNGNLISENLIGNLGQVVHSTDLRGEKIGIFSPYFSQECNYDPVGNLISNIVDGAENCYSYDDLSQLSSENDHIYAHDSLYNRIQKNDEVHEVNDLNELLSVENTYDLNGNQTCKKTPSETFSCTYDPLNRLIEVTSEKKKVRFTYDPLGRCLRKIICTPTFFGWKETTTHEQYLYHGQNEIGSFISDKPTNLRILGITKKGPTTIGIEIEDQIFAPIIDVQDNIRRLIDLKTKATASRYDFTAFGEELPQNSSSLWPFTSGSLCNPWRFASKRFDPDLGLVYFGKRFYDPLMGRWLTTDPAGFVDSVNLYQYVFTR